MNSSAALDAIDQVLGTLLEYFHFMLFLYSCSTTFQRELRYVLLIYNSLTAIVTLQIQI